MSPSRRHGVWPSGAARLGRFAGARACLPTQDFRSVTKGLLSEFSGRVCWRHRWSSRPPRDDLADLA